MHSILALSLVLVLIGIVPLLIAGMMMEQHPVFYRKTLIFATVLCTTAFCLTFFSPLCFQLWDWHAKSLPVQSGAIFFAVFAGLLLIEMKTNYLSNHLT